MLKYRWRALNICADALEKMGRSEEVAAYQEQTDGLDTTYLGTPAYMFYRKLGDLKIDYLVLRNASPEGSVLLAHMFAFCWL